MLIPPLTDLVALLGIDLVLCAAGLRLLASRTGVTQWVKWALIACFLLLWLPFGAAQLPLLAYVRGVSSDLSTTLVALACLSLCRRLFDWPAVAESEKMAVYGALAVAAAVLYPAALGWGDWDAYRPGWGSFGMLGILLMLSLACWVAGLRLLPGLVGLALLAWVAGWMESNNLWDYLMDPWLAIMAMIHCIKTGLRGVLHWYRLRVLAAVPSLP
ncbi:MULTISPECIES: hypothetical protein [unclassified Polaromonas]|uniref:hypothetical protein n=1 Tax=unclassified Polaromonas TaxID=2638319 RepID=UPI0018CB712D|nr:MULTISPECIES: hypothetical protein [unclassified Polaromonas]MBG6070524.1 hypothetical protein [Polaromonas sp. CG_9.7]MBG6112522.1 hypothetical protein [Polaromonas sp. CG_9.2]MDH6184172.1 hypothetical protein [Polaromonas sp. CG_23.6]